MTLTLGTIRNPICCDGPIGERRYLDQLVSEVHGFIQYKRMGSFRTEGNIVVGYAIMNLTGQKITELYFDMYHPGHIEKSIPDGFRRIDQEELEEQLFTNVFDAPVVSSELQEQIIIDQQRHGYVIAKAQRLLLCGPLYYHTQDYFGHPRKGWNWAGIVDASRQLVEQWSGRLENRPICVPNAATASQMLQTFHFGSDNIESLDSTEASVLIKAKHQVTEESLQFWFQRSTFGAQKHP